MSRRLRLKLSVVPAPLFALCLTGDCFDPEEYCSVSGFAITRQAIRGVELITGVGGRRRWLADDKARILEHTLVPGAAVSEVARRDGVLLRQVFALTRQASRGIDGGAAASPSFVPIFVEPQASVVPLDPPKTTRRERAATRTGGGIELELDASKNLPIPLVL